MLPADVRLMCCVGLFCTLRVSEILGLQEKHLDFERSVIQVRQRFYRGDLDETKSNTSRRDVPMGYMVDELRSLCQGDPDRFVFQIETRPEWGRKTATCRDDRDIHQHFLRPAAVALEIYWEGFGWHSLRREAVTSLGAILGPTATMRLAGHATADMSLLYTLADQQAQDAAIRQRQESIVGKTGEKLQ
jgi:integrase